MDNSDLGLLPASNISRPASGRRLATVVTVPSLPTGDAVLFPSFVSDTDLLSHGTNDTASLARPLSGRRASSNSADIPSIAGTLNSSGNNDQNLLSTSSASTTPLRKPLSGRRAVPTDAQSLSASTTESKPIETLLPSFASQVVGKAFSEFDIRAKNTSEDSSYPSSKEKPLSRSAASDLPASLGSGLNSRRLNSSVVPLADASAVPIRAPLPPNQLPRGNQSSPSRFIAPSEDTLSMMIRGVSSFSKEKEKPAATSDHFISPPRHPSAGDVHQYKAITNLALSNNNHFPFYWYF